MKKIYVIGTGGIGISGMARYYNENGYEVFGSDKTDSELIHKLQNEGIDIIIGEDEKRIDNTFEKVIYTEAVPKSQSELKKAIELGIQVLTYPESLGEIANKKKLITIAGTHGKSTTTSMASLVLKNSENNVNALVGTLLKEFNGKNVFFSDSEYFVLEACEYKRSFLAYKPYIGVITNIDLDHLDYYKDLEDYISAFESYVKNIVPYGYLIINGDEENSKKLGGLNLRDDLNCIYIKGEKYIYHESHRNKSFNHGIENYQLFPSPVEYTFPKMNLQVPGEHILFDAKLAYVVGKIIGIQEESIIKSLENYNGVWRRSEIIGMTQNSNILMSDYGHHPTEIKATLGALKGKYSDKKLLVVFQPHQYNRTLELLEEFKNSFNSADILIVPDIYYSRDSKEDMEKINGEKFVNVLNHENKIFGNGLENTLSLIEKFDQENPGDLVIILLGAGNVDDLRYKIETK